MGSLKHGLTESSICLLFFVFWFQEIRRLVVWQMQNVAFVLPLGIFYFSFLQLERFAVAGNQTFVAETSFVLFFDSQFLQLCKTRYYVFGQGAVDCCPCHFVCGMAEVFEIPPSLPLAPETCWITRPHVYANNIVCVMQPYKCSTYHFWIDVFQKAQWRCFPSV